MMKTRRERWPADIGIWLFCIFCAISSTRCEDIMDLFAETTAKPENQKDDVAIKDSRGLFSPRMDYEQWTPLGRGDPLKNDPTYDYVPPVLERVHYWIDPASRKPDPALPGEMNKKTEILVLGVSSKKPSTGFSAADSRTGSLDSFMKFVTGPSFNNYPRMPRPQYSVSQPYYSNFFKKHEKDEHRVPYTMLMPPPMPNKLQDNIPYQQPTMSSTSTTTPIPLMVQATTNAVSIEESNLVYHSSSLSTPEEWKGSNTYATIAEPSSQVTWRTPLEYPKNGTLIPIHSTSTFAVVPSLQPSIDVLLKPMTNVQNTKNIETDIIVTAPEVVMHKGQVTDDTLDLSSTYVNIGKPDAQVHPATGMGMESISISKPPSLPTKSTYLVTSMSSIYRKPQPPVKKLESPMTLQSMQTMQTMQPPPPTKNAYHKASSLIHSLLKKEMNNPTTKYTTTTVATTAPPSTTTVSSLTTDPLFKHYKQPAEPLRGPLYLIIQGHSKVKTYGPSKQINGISVQETNEIQTEDRPTESEYQVKHLHEMMKDNRDMKEKDRRDGRSAKLQSLSEVVTTGLGAIEMQDEAMERSGDVKETEFVVKYDVSAKKEATSEVYHKGIVESELLPFRKERPQSATLTQE